MSYPPTPPYVVAREKIREFADAIGDDAPAYRDLSAARALGYPDLLAPTTFPVLIAQDAVRAVLDDPEVGIDPVTLIHTGLGLRYTRPVVAGDELTAVAVLERMDPIDDRHMFRIRCDIQTVAGEHVVTARTSFIACVRGHH